MEKNKMDIKFIKKWIFRGIRHKNIDSFPKSIKGIIMKNEKNSSKTNSMNLNSTKFSIYFKPSQNKPKGKLGDVLNIRFPFFKKKLSQNRTLKIYNFLSIYKKKVLTRLNFEKFLFTNQSKWIFQLLFITKNLQIKNLINKKIHSNISNLSKFRRSYNLFVKPLKNSIYFTLKDKKVDEIFFKQIRILKDSKFFLKKLKIIPKKNNFLFFYFTTFTNSYYFFRLNFSEFFTNIDQQEVCNIFTKRKYLSNNSSSKFYFLKKIKQNFFKNFWRFKETFSFKKCKLYFFWKISKILTLFFPKLTRFLNFIVTFSFDFGWEFKNLNLKFLFPYLISKTEKETFSNLISSNSFINNDFFFYKESNLILNFIISGNKFKLRFLQYNTNFYKKLVKYNINYETAEILKSSIIYKMKPDFFSSQNFELMKKNSWYNYTYKLFWYFLFKHTPSLFFSKFISLKFSRKFERKLYEAFLRSSEPVIQTSIKEFNLNFVDKKEKSHKKKNNFQKLNAKKKTLNVSNFNVFFKKRIYKLILKKRFGYLEKTCSCKKKFKFPGFLSLKKVQKKKKEMNTIIRNISSFLNLEKILKGFFFKIKSPTPEKSGEKLFSHSTKKQGDIFFFLDRKSSSLNLEIINRIGYVILKNKFPQLYFTCLTRTVYLNRKNKLFQQRNLSTLNPTVSKKKLPFKSNKNNCFYKKYINKHWFQFLFNAKIFKTTNILKKIFKFLKILIKVKKKNIKIIPVNTISLKREDVFNEKLSKNYETSKNKMYFYLYEVLRQSFEIFKCQ